MTFKFNLTKDDFYTVRAYEFSSTRSFRTMCLIERIAGIIIIAVSVYVLRDYFNSMVAIGLFVALALVWVLGFPWIMGLRFKAHAKKEIAESGERVREGEVTLTFGENVIEQRSPGQIVRRMTYKRIIWVEDARKFVLIYDDTNPTPFIIPSKQIFESNEERQKFVKDLRDDCEITVKKRNKVMRGPRLKIQK